MLTLSSVVKPIFNVYLQNSYLKLDVYQKWISSGNDYIPSLVGREILRIKNLNRFSFDESMRALLIKPDTRIGRECVESFYTFCEKHDYLAIDDSELKEVVSRYDIKKIHAFMHNMLDKLEIMDFQKFYFTGSFIRDNYTGEKGSIRYDTFFQIIRRKKKINTINGWHIFLFVLISMMNVFNFGITMLPIG